MKINTLCCTGLLLLGLLCIIGIAAAQDDSTTGTVLTDDIQPYDGLIGADSPLYGLKIALEDIDESFTANETERVGKEMDHARLRLSEVRRALELNESDSAQQALNNYVMKMNLTNVTISRWSSRTTGLLHAQEMIIKHQFVLENLLAGNPNNTGLQRAYNNSIRLQERFEEKTALKFQREIGKNNKTILKAIRLEQKEHDRTAWTDTGTNVTATQTDDKQKGWEKNSGKNTENGNAATNVTMQGQGHQPDNSQNGNGGDKGKGKS